MFSTLRNRFGIPGVISVIALVFAMFGGAYAASSSSGGGKATASAKAKKGPRGPKGATGPAGPAGPAGAKGDAGAPGANGSNGATGPTGPAGPTGLAGAKGKEGAEGSPWTAGGTLPSGATETGMWFFETEVKGEPPTSSNQFFVVNFPIPLAAPITEEEDFHFIQTPGQDAANCPGNFKEPRAAAGQFCLYLSFGNNLENVIPNELGLSGLETSQGGMVLLAIHENSNNSFRGRGSWAVTAP